MQNQSSATLERVYQFLLRCGNEHDPTHFCGAIAKELHHLIPYDQARVLFLDSSGKIRSSLLYGVDKQTWQTFLDYYLDGCTVSSYSLKEPLHLSENEKVHVCDWTDQDTCEAYDLFESTYVRPLQLKYCLGMGLTDQHNCIRCILSFDRTKPIPYSEDELRLIRRLRPLLDNLFINFFTAQNTALNQDDFLFREYSLTKREKEIASLLLSGASPSSISERLCISVATAYKHIANMYKKMHVTNRQEFIARLYEHPPA
ncbi:MAG: helix-turn-helix transcriptional regulator [Eubacteriales bacterium]|nr:helix-turn-helix transcriptional regulator [Eubacteriales bacterium]